MLGYGKPIHFTPVAQSKLLGPITQIHHSWMFLYQRNNFDYPGRLSLIAENLGHIKAVEAMTGQAVSPEMDWCFLLMVYVRRCSSSMGGTGVTTYAENIGVMAVTKADLRSWFCGGRLDCCATGAVTKIWRDYPSQRRYWRRLIVVFGLIQRQGGSKFGLDNHIDFSKNAN